MRPRRYAWVGLAALAASAGCALLELRRDLSQVEKFASLHGQVTRADAESEHPIIVVLYRGATPGVVDFFVLSRPGPFFFAVPGGTYRLAVFEDRNHDFTYQPEAEPAAHTAGNAEIAVRPGEEVGGLELTLDSARGDRIAFAIGPLAAGERDIAELPDVHVGTIVSIDDPRFSAENGKLGLWQPVRFLTGVGAGIYFLEAYDPNKTPILFVHGATGHPREWEFLISRLDRTRYQPWLVYYPTAARLDTTARGVIRWLQVLHARHQFSRLVAVAHSMGGLVTRAAINQRVEYAGRRVLQLPVFVTISTPWGGDAAAQQGVEHAPVVAPSWRDMAPGSAFLRALQQTPLPPECRHHVFFSYRGGAALIGETSDGTVTLASELPLDVQLHAAQVLGFNEDHTSILRSEGVAAQLNQILAAVEG